MDVLHLYPSVTTWKNHDFDNDLELSEENIQSDFFTLPDRKVKISYYLVKRF